MQQEAYPILISISDGSLSFSHYGYYDGLPQQISRSDTKFIFVDLLN